MAHLALVVDEDPDRRERCMANVRRLFTTFSGASVHEARHGDFSCIWVVGPKAPVSVHRDADGFALMIGYAVDDAGRHVSAADIHAGWLASSGSPRLYDGYHVAVAWHARRGLAAGVDPLGLFPFHHATVGSGDGRPLVAATAPEALRCHPLVSSRIDRRGLAGILLVHGPLLNRPLLADTRRMPQGHLLLRSSAGAVSEQAIYRCVGTAQPADETPAQSQRRISDLCLATLRRHRPPEDDASILLSGGLDSRLVAACLAAEGIPAKALILGRPDDFEVVAGAAVARRLGMPLEVVSTEAIDDGFPSRACQAARLNHLTAAPGGDDFAEGLALSASHGKYLWSGMAFDWIFEPVSYADGRDPKTGHWALEGLTTSMNRWGVPMAGLPALLGDDGQVLCNDMIEEVRAACLRGPSPPVLEASRIRWDQRIRNHVGMAVHRTTFHSWPLMPATDRRLCEAIIGLPLDRYEDRALEKAILREIRPNLREVPFDTNSFKFEPMHGSHSHVGRLLQSARSRLRRFYWRRLRGHDPRRYERLFNVDHPRWVATRRLAEPLRPLLHEHLDPKAVARILPRPEIRTQFANPVNQGGAIRLLTGLAFVLEALKQHAPA
jgi:hypothetical protein